MFTISVEIGPAQDVNAVPYGAGTVEPCIRKSLFERLDLTEDLARE